MKNNHFKTVNICWIDDACEVSQ